MRSQVARDAEPIPGYKLIEYLGSGGYGEVWKAEAPGGLIKAIKFVYGRQDEQRAASELRALERIKAVRHPFLLSLERIEILEGRLLIVTELADESLSDRFNACREQGLAGIPRDELLGYLSDAAEALDFMREQHSLQHLDVKPGNLLLLSGRIKMADFGLVKNYRHVTASLMSGLTPLYSAPEVFRGAPSPFSDQYSLAVLYQEMLTGTLPFHADSPAELTLQHLNATPDLSSLPEFDRPVIVRALAKCPTDRFATCKEMTKSLIQIGQFAAQSACSRGAGPESRDDLLHGGAASAARDTPLVSPRPGSMTLVCGNVPGISKVETEDEPPKRAIPQLPDLPVRDLAPIEMEGHAPGMAPTLFLGIGGAAGHVLRHLRRRWHDHLGDPSQVPAIQMLLLDTDTKSLFQSTRGDDQFALDFEETLALPLRRPQEYRPHSAKLLRWLGRRWLFNIPRSLKPEGLRPLGRLALADHAPRVLARIQQAIKRAIDPDSITRSQQSTGYEFSRHPLRVYLIASVSGGTGSGMVIDLAYAVQSVVQKLQLDGTTVGILMHSTGTNPQQGKIADVNAFAWLTEFSHYCGPTGMYPGDESAGIPPSARKAFDHTYLNHLGDGLSKEEFARATQSVADYIYFDALTAAGRFLQTCREDASGSSEPLPAQAQLRSFGLQRVSCFQQDIADSAVAQICKAVLVGWAGHQGQPARRTGQSAAEAKHGNDELCDVDRGAVDAELGIDLKAVLPHLSRVMTTELGGDLRQFFEKVVGAAYSGSEVTWEDLVQKIDDTFGDTQDRDDPCTRLGHRRLEDIVAPLVEPVAAGVRQRVLREIEDREIRLQGALQTCRRFAQRLSTVEADASTAVRRGRSAASSLLESASLHGKLSSTHRKDAAKLDQLQRYLLARFDECTWQCVVDFVRSVSAEIAAISEKLADLNRGLSSLMEAAAGGTSRNRDAGTSFEEPAVADVRGAIQQALQRRQKDLAAQVDHAIRAEFIDKHGGLFAVLTQQAKLETDLLATLRQIARRVVKEALTEVDLFSRVLPLSEDDKAKHQNLRHYLEAVFPRLLQHGGAKRVLIALPCSARESSARLKEQLPKNVSLTVDSNNELTICCEAQDLSLARVALGLIRGRSDYVELATRVHTRHDVRWASLIDFQTPEPTADPADPAGPAGEDHLPSESFACSAGVPPANVG